MDEAEKGRYESSRVRRRVARRERFCGVGVPAYCFGSGFIRPGDVYLEWTDFPGDDPGYATTAGHPVRMAECAACAERCGRAHLLAVAS